MDWTRTDRGTWVAHGPRWSYELTHWFSSLFPANTDTYLMRVTRIATGEAKTIGAYRTLDGAQKWAERYEAKGVDHFRSDNSEEEESEEPNYG